MIGVERAAGVLRITLRRPEKRNALTPGMLAALVETVRGAGPDDRVICLRGEGRVFCSGFDLDLCRDDGPDQPVMRGLLTGLHEAVSAMRGASAAVVVAAHGAAVAGGCALLGGADVVVADRGAKLGYPVTRLGISPAVSGPFLRQGVHDGGARARLLDSSLISGERAHALGLVHELTATPEAALERAEAVAASLALKPGGAVTATKRWLAAIAPVEHEDEALRASLSLVTGAEAAERLALFWRDR